MSFIGHLFASIGLFFASIFGSFPHATSDTQRVTPPNLPVEQTTQTPNAQALQNSQVSTHASQSGTSHASSASPVSTINTSSSGASVSGKVYSQSDLLAMAGPVDLTTLPLGDNLYTTSGPKKGYVYICHVASGGAGAQVNGPWIHGSTWDATTKVAVQGSVPWPNASIKISLNGGTRSIVDNDLPTNHNTGTFPVQASDPAVQYDRNPSSVTAQNNSLNLPANPTILSTPDCIYGVVGTMTNGVTLNDAFDALYRDAPAHEEQDSCEGHPNNEEGYHYHSLSTCFKSPTVDQVIGWADDGFPITGPLVADGKYLSSADLDECHGLTSTINEDGKSVTTYHYVMTYDFPYSVSCFRGKSYEPKPGGPSTISGSSSSNQQGGQGSQMSGTPPQAAIDACSGKSTGASCSFSAPVGTISGTCQNPPNSSLACVPSH